MRAMAQPDSTSPEPGPDAGLDDIEADIERTRKDLGETVGALSAKLDVKERAKDKAAETKERVVEKTHAVGQVASEPKVKVPLWAALVVGLTLGVVLWRRRH
jgi:hypothetical protein